MIKGENMEIATKWLEKVNIQALSIVIVGEENKNEEAEIDKTKLKPLKLRYNVTKLDFIVPMLSFLHIDIDLSIQLISLILYMILVQLKLHRRYKSWVPCK